jgi:hypothetical protein
MSDLRQLLVTVLKNQRAHAAMMRDLGAQFQAFYDYLENRDPGIFPAEFRDFKAKAQAEADNGLEVGNALEMLEFDRLIGQLEADEAPKM